MRNCSAAFLVLLAACSTDVIGPEPGTERGPCYGNGTCNAGLLCASDLCVLVPDSGTLDPDATVPTDAGDAPDAGAQVGDDAGDDDAQIPDARIDDASGADTGPGDAGPRPDAMAGRDALPGADSGPEDSGFSACNPVDDVGCDPTAGELCRWLVTPDLAECRARAGTLGFEAACDLAAQNCGSQLVCLQAAGAAGPTCHRVCALASGVGCGGLSGASASYTCASVFGSTRFGACMGQATCHPLGPACPANQVCTISGQSNLTCQTAGTSVEDATCAASNCAVGAGLCIDLGGGPNCREPCNPSAPACGGGDRCVSIIGTTYGVCLPSSCQPFTNPCPSGSVCTSSAGPIECRAAGGVAVGATCDAQNECAAGFCVNIGNGQRCYATCDATHACAAGTCATLQGLTFGVCV